jgi:2'-5' RNA ligase
MRLFIAVNFDDEIKSRLLRIQSRIREQSLKGNFSRPENLHLTLVFLGETPPQQISLIRSAMERVCAACQPFSLDFDRTSFFKHSNKELWWTGSGNAAAGLQNMEKLRQGVAEGLCSAGVKFDERPFNPHITLGREIRRAGPIELPKENICVPINRISLMQSEHSAGRLVYTELYAVDLKGLLR